VEKESFLEEESVENFKFNIIIVRSMINMLQIVGIVPLTILKDKAIIQKKNMLF